MSSLRPGRVAQTTAPFGRHGVLAYRIANGVLGELVYEGERATEDYLFGVEHVDEIADRVSERDRDNSHRICGAHIPHFCVGKHGRDRLGGGRPPTAGKLEKCLVADVGLHAAAVATVTCGPGRVDDDVADLTGMPVMTPQGVRR